jgi:hypothetical protein
MATPGQTPQDTANNSVPTFTDSKDLAKITTGPFFSTDGIDRFRPFYSYLEPHDASTATIILTVKSQAIGGSVSGPTTDYFKSFNSKVSTLLPDSKVVGNNIPELDLVGNDNGKFYGVFRNFSLLQYSESRSEIAKVALNFGSKWNAYFFGSQPRVYNFGGFFLDSKNYPYYEQFMKAYDNYLAGGKCVSHGFRLYMAYDNKITSGWMLGINVSGNSEQPFSRTFSFQLLVDDENWFRTNWEYDVTGQVIDTESRVLSNLYQIPGVTK